MPMTSKPLLATDSKAASFPSATMPVTLFRPASTHRLSASSRMAAPSPDLRWFLDTQVPKPSTESADDNPSNQTQIANPQIP